MSEHEQPPGPAENLAEIMAWHGMARYAEPDALDPYVRAVPAPGHDQPPDQSVSR